MSKLLQIQPACANVSGSRFSACDSGSSFLGCCDSTEDPCITGCSNVQPATFNTAAYNDILPQSCLNESLWWVCSADNPPFMGCCKSNPCGSGCPEGNLTAAYLSQNRTNAAAFLPNGDGGNDGHHIYTGSIAGGVIAGVIVLALLLSLFYQQRRRGGKFQLLARKRGVSSSHGPIIEAAGPPHYGREGLQPKEFRQEVSPLSQSTSLASSPYPSTISSMPSSAQLHHPYQFPRQEMHHTPLPSQELPSAPVSQAQLASYPSRTPGLGISITHPTSELAAEEVRHK